MDDIRPLHLSEQTTRFLSERGVPDVNTGIGNGPGDDEI